MIKTAAFDFLAFHPDTDTNGEENYNNPTSVGRWAETDAEANGQVIARRDERYQSIRTAAILMLSMNVVLCAAELYLQHISNVRAAKHRKHLVHPDRCPICSLPASRGRNLAVASSVRQWVT